MARTTVRSTEATVQVSVRVPRPAADLFAALHEPDRLAAWFGELNGAWTTGGAHIEFGDGDFFLLTPAEVVDGVSITFDWSFLGVGPYQTVRWAVREMADGAELTVTDHDPDRSPAEAAELAEGWSDFLRRLDRYLNTGRPSRYAWREDIDGSVNLEDPLIDPLRGEALLRWLPIATDGFRPRWFFIVDADGPRRFPVEGWEQPGAWELRFDVVIPGSATPEDSARTSCTVRVETDGGTPRLRFSHTGWHGLGLPDGKARTLRHRFAKTWAASLELARELATPG